MSEVLEIQDRHNYIQVTFIGEFSVEASKRTIDEIIQACSSHDRSAVLLDCRSMTGRLPVLDRYQVAVYGQKMIGKILRFALVRTHKAGPIDLFTETVARNRGVNLKLFTDIDQAIGWLKA